MPGRRRSGIFVFAVLFFFTATAIADCLPSGPLEAVQVDTASDGDSLRLRDGQRLRLLSINAPERARDGKAGEDFAEQAHRALIALLPANKRVYIRRYGSDRYQRLLAEVYTRPDGGHLGEALLRQGLARFIAVPPQLRQPDSRCLIAAEQQARQNALGLWSRPIAAATDLSHPRDSGFKVIRGRVEKISTSATAIWVDLDGDVVLRISKRDQSHFADQPWQHWPGKEIEVRGWLRWRKTKGNFAPLKMDLRHPLMIEVLDPDTTGGTESGRRTQ